MIMRCLRCNVDLLHDEFDRIQHVLIRKLPHALITYCSLNFYLVPLDASVIVPNTRDVEFNVIIDVGVPNTSNWTAQPKNKSHAHCNQCVLLQNLSIDSHQNRSLYLHQRENPSLNAHPPLTAQQALQLTQCMQTCHMLDC